MATHAEDLKFRLATIELLRIAKKHHTYRSLSAKTKLPVTVLSRYVKGHVLPSTDRASDLWQTLSKIVDLEAELRSRIKFDSKGFFDNTSMVGDIDLLSQAANHALAKFAGRRITKVLTAAVDGVPLATMIADALGVNIVIAKPTKEVGVFSFIDETYTVEGSGHTVTLYLPRDSIRRHKRAKEEYRTEKEALDAIDRWEKRGCEAWLSNADPVNNRYEVEVLRIYDSVLVVDDVIKSGDTQAALLNLVKKARAEVSGVFAMIAVGDSWKEKMKIPENCQVEIIVQV